VKSYPRAVPSPEVILEIGESALTPIKFTDPFVGDTIIAVPVAKPDAAIMFHYSFIDFRLLKTACGVAVQQLSDDLRAAVRKNDIILTSVNGLNIAPKLHKDPLSSDAFYIYKQYASVNSVLGMVNFDVTRAATFMHTYADINDRLVTSKSSNKSAAWANMALFYLANSFYVEAKMAFEIAVSYDSTILSNYKATLMKAVIEFMNKNYSVAHELLHDIDIGNVNANDIGEVQFWQAIMEYAMFLNGGVTDITSATSGILYTFRNMQKNFLQDYTNSIVSKISFTLAQYLIKTKYYEKDTRQTLGSMMRLKMSNRDNNLLQYYIAEFYEGLNDTTTARNSLNKCMRDVEDQKHYVMCAIKRNNLLLNDRLITNAQYLDNLKDILVIWRGDNIELKALETLGDVYYKNGDYMSAVKYWNVIVQNFPNISVSLRNKMGQTFAQFFIDTTSQINVNPLEALAFFYKYQNFIQIGNIGDEIILKVVSYMLQLDLLNNAIALLEHQTKNRLFGIRKEKAINLLMQAYIANEQPTNAIAIIEKHPNAFKDIFGSIAIERKYMYAKALLSNKQYNKVLEFLKDDDSQDADDILANLYWQMKHWSNFNDYSEPYIYFIRSSKHELLDKDVYRILKQSVSYIALNQNKLFATLHFDFKGRLPKENKHARIIELLAKIFQTRSRVGIEGANRFTSLVNELNTQLQ
ncbi:MAG: hypothetical protein HYS39_00100, partial [Proteobacteria bacterium]|nr:hypothetical protein [Pseudomonadota bacterium]